MIRTQLPWAQQPKTPPHHLIKRKPIPQSPISHNRTATSANPHYLTVAPAIQTNNNSMKDILFRSSSHYVHPNSLTPRGATELEQTTKDQQMIKTTNGASWKKKYAVDLSPFQNKIEDPYQVSGDVKYLNGEVRRLRKELKMALLQKQNLKERVKTYEEEKQEAVSNKNRCVISLLQDYQSMKSIVQKLIEDNLKLNSENQRLQLEINNIRTRSDPTEAIRKLQEQVTTLKRNNSELQAEKRFSEQYKELLRIREQEIQNMRVNSLDMQDKLKELLDGLKFYHDRFEQEKAELLDEHDNFKKSAVSQISRLKRELLQRTKPVQAGYDYESDPNYIKLITY